MFFGKKKKIPEKSCISILIIRAESEFIYLQPLAYKKDAALLFLVILPSATDGLHIFIQLWKTQILLTKTEKLLHSSLPLSFTSAIFQ